jgi:glycosyltransferase involved in cell wall biosynthesis
VSRRLRIAQVAPIAGPVTPDHTGSVEQLVWRLTEELVRRGHDVTLFATGDSRTAARLHARYPRGYNDDGDLWNWELHESMHTAAAFERAAEFDVIHSHNYHFALPFTQVVDTPVVHTYHVLPDDDIARGFACCPAAHVAAVSHYQRRFFCGVEDVAVIHHGIDTAAFPFSPRRGDYLLFLGRLIPGKGPVEAIRLARQVGMRLVLAGPSDDDEDFFRSEVVPLLDGRQAEYVGAVGLAERNSLLAGAAALVYPLAAPEPFGLVLIEAMACGTPVAALEVGAVPEIVEGVTGRCAADLQELAAALPAVLELDRARVRQTAVARFDCRRMVDDYVALYRRLAHNRRRQAV